MRTWYVVLTICTLLHQAQNQRIVVGRSRAEYQLARIGKGVRPLGELCYRVSVAAYVRGVCVNLVCGHHGNRIRTHGRFRVRCEEFQKPSWVQLLTDGVSCGSRALSEFGLDERIRPHYRVELGFDERLQLPFVGEGKPLCARIAVGIVAHGSALADCLAHLCAETEVDLTRGGLRTHGRQHIYLIGCAFGIIQTRLGSVGRKAEVLRHPLWNRLSLCRFEERLYCIRYKRSCFCHSFSSALSTAS